jgi:outer membrane protein W
MKRFFLVFGLAASTFAATAQTNEEFKSFKPFQGDVTTELGLAGGLNDADFVLNEGSGLLRFRYFMKDKLALRAGFNLSSASEKEYIYGVGADKGRKGTETMSATSLTLNVGIEKHFAGTARLSPYVGGDILFGVAGNKYKAVDTDGDEYINNFSIESKGPGAFSIGLRGVVGADFYISKHVYLGAEAGFGFNYAKEGKQTVTIKDGGTTTTTTMDSNGSAFSLNPSVITGIRVGFVF